MKITCPHCGLVGKIGEDKLKASSGSVRCPRCHEAFTPTGGNAPAGGKVSAGVSGGPPNKKPAKKDPVLFGARSGDDVPFTRIMEENELMPEEDVIIEIEGMGATDIPGEIGAQEIISLGEDDIVSTDDTLSVRDEAADEGGAQPVLAGGAVPQTPGDIPDSISAGVVEKRPVARPQKGLLGLFDRGRKAPTQAGRLPAAGPAPHRAGIRKGFILFFIIVLALWGGYRFFSTYWPPYAQEKQFLTDSRALFDKYHELRVYLQVGLPDPVFATKVAEAAYVWEVYREKHESRYRKDPLFASLMIMGRLFLTIKELLDRDMYPDNYLGLEWGEGFPFPTKEDYVNAMVGGIPICIKATEENFAFSKKVLDTINGLSFISMTASDILGQPGGPSRADYGPDLKRANKAFMVLDTQMPVLKKAISDVRDIINDLPGK